MEIRYSHSNEKKENGTTLFAINHIIWNEHE